MNFTPVAQIAETLLYEGYALYPYRATAVKNQQRWTFGCLLPPTFPQPTGSAEGSNLQCECLVLGGLTTQIEIAARFLQLTTPTDGATRVWNEASAREVNTPQWNLHALALQTQRVDFTFPAADVGGQYQESIEGSIDISAERLGDDAYKLRVRLLNRTRLEHAEHYSRTEALAWSLLSCHLLLGAHDGEFVSSLDPPARWDADVARCRNIGVYPVLAGDKNQRSTMLAAPIILYDYPRVAPASPGDLCDATEMDEMLTLRIQTLTDDEKQAMASLDPRTAQMLQRCDTMSADQLRDLHGVWQRDDLTPGMRVRLRPHGRADAFDLVLADKTAVIVSTERDFEDRDYVSVVLDDDPGQDLGVAGKPGHRFYFRPDEVEVLFDDKVTR